MPQDISIKTFYTSKCTSFFTFVLFLNVLADFHKKNLSNQLSNSITNFGCKIKQPELRVIGECNRRFHFNTREVKQLIQGSHRFHFNSSEVKLPSEHSQRF